eukprot:42600-Prymnesium_polylepis.1
MAERFVSGGCKPDADYCIKLVGRESRKSAITNEEKMGPYQLMLARALMSAEFTSFLQELAGIERPLISDATYQAGGFAYVASGGRLGLHADFNKYEKYGLDRRVNMFLYVNHDWPDTYGGHLELWYPNVSTCAQRIHPTWNRLVVFSTTDWSYHGHPTPMMLLPYNRMRRSLALYFYSKGRPHGECKGINCEGKAHGTTFIKPMGCQQCEEPACAAYPQ